MCRMCSGFFCSFKIGLNEIIRFYNKVKEKTILHCVDSKANTLYKNIKKKI